jgi:hypothetical protein
VERERATELRVIAELGELLDQRADLVAAFVILGAEPAGA